MDVVVAPSSHAAHERQLDQEEVEGQAGRRDGAGAGGGEAGEEEGGRAVGGGDHPLELDDATTSEIQGAVAAARQEAEGPPSDGAVLYLGHIPHGFYEEQMRGFFGQFGTVTRLRLSRKKKRAGRSTTRSSSSSTPRSRRSSPSR